MEVLHIIVSVLGLLSYSTTIFFATSAFFKMKLYQDKLSFMETSIQKILIITLGERMRKNFEDLNELKHKLAVLIEHEQYEEAQKLRKVIEKVEENAFKSLKNFQKTFGEDMCEIVISEINNDKDE